VTDPSRPHAAGDAPDPEGRPPVTRAERRWLVAILAAFVVLSVTYSAVIPLGYGPDEPRHYAYVKLLMERRLLPRTYPDGRERDGAIAVHPPLYYAVLGTLYYPAKALGGAWLAQRVYRLVSTGLGVCALVCIWAAARLIVPGRPGLAPFIAAVAAFTPHFLMDQSIINNDAAANAACPFFVWFVLERRRRGWRLRDAAYCGVLLGLFALLKGQALACLPPVFLTVLACDYGRGFWRRGAFWARAGVGVGLLAALGGWWYVRNLVLYGQITYLPTSYRGIPLGMSFVDAWVEGVIPSLALRAVVGLFQSLWAQIGWFPEGAAAGLYAVLALLLAVAVGGWIALLLQRRAGKPVDLLGRPRELIALFLTFVVTYGLVFYIAVFQHIGWFQGGRYVLVGLGGFTTFLALGWQASVPARFRVAGVAIVLALLLLLNALSLANLAGHLNPTYAPDTSFWTPIAGT